MLRKIRELFTDTTCGQPGLPHPGPARHRDRAELGVGCSYEVKTATSRSPHRRAQRALRDVQARRRVIFLALPSSGWRSSGRRQYTTSLYYDSARCSRAQSLTSNERFGYDRASRIAGDGCVETPILRSTCQHAPTRSSGCPDGNGLAREQDCPARRILSVIMPGAMP